MLRKILEAHVIFFPSHSPDKIHCLEIILEKFCTIAHQNAMTNWGPHGKGMICVPSSVVRLVRQVNSNYHEILMIFVKMRRPGIEPAISRVRTDALHHSATELVT